MIRLILFGTIGIIVGFIAGYFVATKVPTETQTKPTNCLYKYSFINEQLDCEPKQTIQKKEYTEFVYNLEQYIATEKNLKNVEIVSIYFRDLKLGPTFNIASGESFVPASLLKVPLMVAYLSLAESDLTILEKQTKYMQVNKEVTQTIDEDKVIQINTLYSVDDLISRMIINSDNLAYGLLVKYLDRLYPNENKYLQILKELGLVNPRDPTESTFTVKSYASIFRQLYNGSYLSPVFSEKALKLLANTTFDKGLKAGVPNNIIVSHKYGDREGLAKNEKQLHDCGIIYYPDNPYLLCIMTRGNDSDMLINVIKTISAKVYKEVDSRKY